MMAARIALTALMVASLFGLGLMQVAADESATPTIALNSSNQDLVGAAR